VSTAGVSPAWLSGPVVVRAPATSANLGPGFDSFGLALSLRDAVTARITAGGLDVSVTGAGAETASAGERHLVVRAMRAAFDAIGSQPPGIALSCQNVIPHGFGLGSSAAAIVAGVAAARALAGEQGAAALPDIAALRLAADLEGHSDNVAASLLGGLTIAWPSAPGQVDAIRLDPHPALAPVVCIPEQPLATEVARRALPATVPHADAAANSARTALLVTALTTRPELLLAGTEDFLHQQYRSTAMPATAALIARLRAAGIAAAVSGAGPSVLALPASGEALAAVRAVAADGWQVLELRADPAGVQVTAG
jgi:homoserine kinase